MRFFSQKSGFFFQALKLETFFSGLLLRQSFLVGAMVYQNFQHTPIVGMTLSAVFVSYVSSEFA